MPVLMPVLMPRLMSSLFRRRRMVMCVNLMIVVVGARDSPSLMMLVLVATIGVLLYTTFLFDFSNRGNWIRYLMVLTAESVIIVQALLSLWTILSSGHKPAGYRFHNAQTRCTGRRRKR